MGELPAALDRYTDIPADVRTKLKERVAMQQYDDMVEIRRDAIVGKGTYGPDIREMHFGPAGTVCKTVSRKKWKASTVERALVYCESATCVLVPTVCRNVALVTRTDKPTAKLPEPPPPANPSKPEAPPPATPPSPAPEGPPVVAVGPAFNDVAQAPSFGFPGGSVGGITVIAPPAGGTGGGGTDPGGGTPGGGGTVPDPGGGGGGGGGGTVGGEVVTPIPEPSSWALMLGGLLAVGFLARRRGGY